MSDKRIIVVANRLPVSITAEESSYKFKPSPGGLASALGSLENHNQLWIGWPGEIDPEDASDSLRTELREKYNAIPIFLNRRQLKRYYFGFSNRALWPVLHYLPVYIRYDERDYRTYHEVNQAFADAVIEALKEDTGDDVVWIHDYQLMLVPQMVRNVLPDAKIGFFLHTPFPSSEMFRALPYREELLRGILGANLIGFHTYSYLRHFRSSILHILGIESEIDRIELDSHQVRIGAFPISIDTEKIRKLAESPELEDDQNIVRQIIHGRKMILSVDRMDYTKGLPERLRAYKKFLMKHPERARDTILVQIAVPSRTQIPDYQTLKDEVEEIVLDIEETFETESSPPIHFIYRSLPFKRLVAFYREANIALVTPFFDGMNLVAKEFVAVKKDRGVLILSEHAGAAAELGEALIINPWNPDQISQALETALAMGSSERTRRMEAMFVKVSRNNVHYWARSFLQTLEQVETHSVDFAGPSRIIDRATETDIFSKFARSKRRLIMLDYDGTLTDIVSLPMDAVPDAEILDMLKSLVKLPQTDVIIISGRKQNEISEWLDGLGLGFSTEHGLFIKMADETDWHRTLPADHNFSWYDIVREIFTQFNLRTPGSFTEEKQASLAWHYRLSDPTYGRWQARELNMHLNDVLANQPLEVLQGKMVVEVRVQGVNKGNIIHRLWELQREYDFMLGIGDDSTDEYLFSAMPENSYSVKVGQGLSHAGFRLRNVRDVRRFLGNLCDSTH